MKILIISDLHANFPALEAVWEKESDSDVILCAGDLVDWGFYPIETLDWCREHKVISVSGNHDQEICAHYRAGNTAPEGSLAKWQVGILSPEHITYLEALPERHTEIFGDFGFYMKHFYNDDELDRTSILGRWISMEAKMTFDETWPVSLQVKHRVILTGHSHQSCLYQVGGEGFFLNPGSISYRNCSDHRIKGADYAILQDGEFRLRHVDYDQTIYIPLCRDAELTVEHRRIATALLCPNP